MARCVMRSENPKNSGPEMRCPVLCARHTSVQGLVGDSPLKDTPVFWSVTWEGHRERGAGQGAFQHVLEVHSDGRGDMLVELACLAAAPRGPFYACLLTQHWCVDRSKPHKPNTRLSCLPHWQAHLPTTAPSLELRTLKMGPVGPASMVIS